MPTTHSEKFKTEASVPRCYVLFPFPTICNHLGTGDTGSDPETRPHSTFPPLFSPSVDELKRTLWCFCAAVTDVWLPPGVTEFQVAFLEPATNCVEWQWFSKVLPPIFIQESLNLFTTPCQNPVGENMLAIGRQTCAHITFTCWSWNKTKSKRRRICVLCCTVTMV